jgi:hypothetical protein
MLGARAGAPPVLVERVKRVQELVTQHHVHAADAPGLVVVRHDEMRPADPAIRESAVRERAVASTSESTTKTLTAQSVPSADLSAASARERGTVAAGVAHLRQHVLDPAVLPSVPEGSADRRIGSYPCARGSVRPGTT